MGEWLNKRLRDRGEDRALKSFRAMEGPDIGYQDLNSTDEQLITIGRRSFAKEAVAWLAVAAATATLAVGLEQSQSTQAHTPPNPSAHVHP